MRNFLIPPPIPVETMKPKAILFDLDGVLIDSLDAWWHALNDALRHFNMKEMTKEEFVSKYWGYDLYTNIKRANLPFEIGISCSRFYLRHLDKVKLHPSAPKILNGFKKIKKGLVTNTPRDCTEEVLRRFDLSGYFDVIITGDDVSKGKPDPEIIFKACNHLNVNPREVVLVGDTESDVKAGRMAGCYVIGVNVNGDMTIKDISELLNILEDGTKSEDV